jgi:LacI family transcriptional regulator
VRGAEDAAYEAGYDVVLCNSGLDAARQMRYLRSLREKRVAGILINSVHALSAAQQEELATYKIPVVLLNEIPSPHSFSTVLGDNFQGGMLAANYLIGLGHRKIAHLTGPRQHGNLMQRCLGFLDAARSNSTEVKPVVLHGAHTRAGGYEITKKLLARSTGITAIFAASDTMAFGALQAIREAGMDVPKDVSVMGFDNVDVTAIVHPPLTTIHQPKYEMGRAAVEILLKPPDPQSGFVPEHRRIGVSLIVRESCGAPPGSTSRTRGRNRS